MLTVKEAVQVAKLNAAEMIGPLNFSLEEIEREDYSGRDVWAITLGYLDLRSAGSAAAVSEQLRPFFNSKLIYKRFLVDAETGELAAMKLREPALG